MRSFFRSVTIAQEGAGCRIPGNYSAGIRFLYGSLGNRSDKRIYPEDLPFIFLYLSRPGKTGYCFIPGASKIGIV